MSPSHIWNDNGEGQEDKSVMNIPLCNEKMIINLQQENEYQKFKIKDLKAENEVLKRKLSEQNANSDWLEQLKNVFASAKQLEIKNESALDDVKSCIEEMKIHEVFLEKLSCKVVDLNNEFMMAEQLKKELEQAYNAVESGQLGQ